MKDIQQKNDLSFEEVLQDPSLAHLHGLVRYVQKTPFSQMFPKKNELSLMSIVAIETRALFFKNPNIPIKTVVTTIFERLTDDIPAPLVLKLTQKIIAKWESLSVELPQNRETMAVV